MSDGASSSDNTTNDFFTTPDLPNSNAYITEIHKIFEQLKNDEPSGDELTRVVFMLIGMAKKAKQKMEEEKKDKAEIDAIMEAIGSLQIKAFQNK